MDEGTRRIEGIRNWRRCDEAGGEGWGGNESMKREDGGGERL